MNKLAIISIIILFFSSCGIKKYEKVTESYPGGQVKLRQIFLDEDFTKLHQEIFYYESGKIRMQGFWENDKKNGQWQYFYPDGTLWSEAEYVDGIENGNKAVYYENGTIYYQGTMKNGERTGEWQFYSTDGNLEETINYP